MICASPKLPRSTPCSLLKSDGYPIRPRRHADGLVEFGDLKWIDRFQFDNTAFGPVQIEYMRIQLAGKKNSKGTRQLQAVRA